MWLKHCHNDTEHGNWNEKKVDFSSSQKKKKSLEKLRRKVPKFFVFLLCALKFYLSFHQQIKHFLLEEKFAKSSIHLALLWKNNNNLLKYKMKLTKTFFFINSDKFSMFLFINGFLFQTGKEGGFFKQPKTYFASCWKEKKYLVFNINYKQIIDFLAMMQRIRQN